MASDPLPTSVLILCRHHFLGAAFRSLLSAITRTVNFSVTTGVMAETLKIAPLSPTLKKPAADLGRLQSSSSKLVEKSAAVQLKKHVMTNHRCFNLHTKYFIQLKQQYFYRRGNDSLFSLHKKSRAAFDAVDHAILISRLLPLRSEGNCIGLV